MIKRADKTLVIAEIGINHNGNLDTAKRLIEQAAVAGADVVKFQTFQTDHLVTENAPLAVYQACGDERVQNQAEMLRPLELSQDVHVELAQFSQNVGIEFMSTAFDQESLEFLVGTLNIDRLKVASGEITNGPFLYAHAQHQLPMLVSTGMASLQEVDQAMTVIGCGLNATSIPNEDSLTDSWRESKTLNLLRDKVTLLQCTSQYPAPNREINLRAMQLMRERYGVAVGYSDHTEGSTAALAAVAMGAEVIEKHITLDKEMAGPDHKASIEPTEFRQLVQQIREVELVLGQAEKQAQPCERQNLEVSRRSLFASRVIKEGERFSVDNVTIKRPGGFKSPMQYWTVLGQRARRKIAKGDPIE